MDPGTYYILIPLILCLLLLWFYSCLCFSYFCPLQSDYLDHLIIESILEDKKEKEKNKVEIEIV